MNCYFHKPKRSASDPEPYADYVVDNETIDRLQAILADRPYEKLPTINFEPSADEQAWAAELNDWNIS